MERETGMNHFKQVVLQKRFLLIAAAVLAAIYGILSIAPYLLMLEIIKPMTGSTRPVMDELRNQVASTAWVMVIAYFSFYLSAVTAHMAAYEILFRFRVLIANKMSSMSLGNLQKRTSGALKKLLVDDVEKLEVFIAHNIPDLVKAIVLPIVVLVFMFTVDYRLALASLAPFVLFLLWMMLAVMTKGTAEMTREFHQKVEKMDSVIVEYVRALNVMKLFGQEAKSFANYRDTVEDLTLFSSVSYRRVAPMYSALTSFISNSLLPIVTVGLLLYFENSVELPVLLLFFIVGMAYLKPVLGLSGFASSLSDTLECTKRISNLINQKDMHHALAPTQVPQDYSITYKDVHFDYKGDSDEEVNSALKGINLSIPAGKVTALVGPSGAGKSTCAELLSRFHDASQGAIEIGGVNIQNIQYDDLMNIVSFVFQDNFLFADTIAANIDMGAGHSREEIERAAKLAQAHEFIQSLPSGYDTQYGQDGLRLSGGQAQRIQLARIILKDAPIFILDEATAFADALNESAIQKALSQIIPGKTVIVIAHRLSTIVNAAQIVVFDQGKTVAAGTHTSLLESSNLYASMWEAHQSAREFSLGGGQN